MEPYQSFPCVEVPLFARPSGLLGCPHIFRVSQQILSRKAKIIVKPKQCRSPFNLTDFFEGAVTHTNAGPADYILSEDLWIYFVPILDAGN